MFETALDKFIVDRCQLLLLILRTLKQICYVVPLEIMILGMILILIGTIMMILVIIKAAKSDDDLHCIFPNVTVDVF